MAQLSVDLQTLFAEAQLLSTLPGGSIAMALDFLEEDVEKLILEYQAGNGEEAARQNKLWEQNQQAADSLPDGPFKLAAQEAADIAEGAAMMATANFVECGALGRLQLRTMSEELWLSDIALGE